MKNSEIVKILEDIADLLELKGENIFKSRAYQKAARSIEFLSEDVEKLVAEDRLREMPGVGEAIEKKLTELVKTGHMEYYDKLRSEFPEGIGTFLEIPGIGPHTALLLARDLGITTVDELEKAIEGRPSSPTTPHGRKDRPEHPAPDQSLPQKEKRTAHSFRRRLGGRRFPDREYEKYTGAEKFNTSRQLAAFPGYYWRYRSYGDRR